MICYLDASALLKRYVREAGRSEVLTLLEENICATSRWTEVEVASALSRRGREGALTAADRDRALYALRDDMAWLYVVETHQPVVALARDLLTRHPLRAGDAIQLASALHLQRLLERPLAFAAYDLRLNEVAHREGMRITGPTTLSPQTPPSPPTRP